MRNSQKRKKPSIRGSIKETRSLNFSEIKNNSFTYNTGSSSGCAWVAILVSLALQKPIYQNLAMTGEISFDGKIGKVSGIDKKVPAAIEAGLKIVIMPKANKPDFKALTAEIKKKVKPFYAETFEDIYNVAFAFKPKIERVKEEKNHQQNSVA